MTEFARLPFPEIVCPRGAEINLRIRAPEAVMVRGLDVAPGEMAFPPYATVTQRAAMWLVRAVLVGAKSLANQKGDIPADLFAHDAIDVFVAFGKPVARAETGQDITVTVIYIGTEDAETIDGAVLVEPVGA